MTKYKLISKATSSGYRKTEEDILRFGFPEIGLIPVEHDGKIYIPTGYVTYKKISE